MSKKCLLGWNLYGLVAENRIIQDIVRIIRKAGKITSTADYQINRLVEDGKSTEEVEKILRCSESCISGDV